MNLKTLPSRQESKVDAPKTGLLPRSNRERTDITRAALIAAGAELFVEKGYAATGTPEVVSRAQLTRGALYHHFADKQDLFFAVCMQTAMEVAQAIDVQARDAATPLDALIQGAEGYFEAMAERGRARLLLIEAPSALSFEQRQQLYALSGQEQLEAGLKAALPKAQRDAWPIKALAAMISAAFDEAALAIAQGQNEVAYKQAMALMLRRITQSP
jgi:AcrR family transcriptional regulator